MKSVWNNFTVPVAALLIGSTMFVFIDIFYIWLRQTEHFSMATLLSTYTYALSLRFWRDVFKSSVAAASQKCSEDCLQVNHYYSKVSLSRCYLFIFAIVYHVLCSWQEKTGFMYDYFVPSEATIRLRL